MLLTVLDVFESVGENEELHIYNKSGEEIARYDGRDSIPEELNDAYIFDLFTRANYTAIILD